MALAHLLQNLMENGHIFSNVLSVNKGRDSSPFLGQWSFSLSSKLLDLVVSFIDFWVESGHVPVSGQSNVCRMVSRKPRYISIPEFT